MLSEGKLEELEKVARTHLSADENARIAWLEAELADEPNRPVYGDGSIPPCRNGHEVTELECELAQLRLQAALAALRAQAPAPVGKVDPRCPLAECAYRRPDGGCCAHDPEKPRDSVYRAAWALCDDTEGTVFTDTFGEHYHVPKASWDRLAEAVAGAQVAPVGGEVVEACLLCVGADGDEAFDYCRACGRKANPLPYGAGR